MTQILSRAEIRGPLYFTVTLVMDALDLLAKRMTGDERALIDRPHSTGG